MTARTTRTNIRRQQVREKRAQSYGSAWRRALATALSWPVIVCALFATAAIAIALLGEKGVPYAVGERLSQPIYASVNFTVPDDEKTRANRDAAAAAVPSYYALREADASIHRIRADLTRYTQIVVEAESYEAFAESVKEYGWPVLTNAEFDQLRAALADISPDDFRELAEALRIEQEYIVKPNGGQSRNPAPTVDYFILQSPKPDGTVAEQIVPMRKLVRNTNEKALKGSAGDLAQMYFRPYALASALEPVLVGLLEKYPTISYDRDRTTSEIALAREATAPALKLYAKGDIIVEPHAMDEQVGMTAHERELLLKHHEAYLAFLADDTPESRDARRARMLEQAGFATVIALLSIGLVVYTWAHRPMLFFARRRSLTFIGLCLLALATGRALVIAWSDKPELVIAPILLVAGIFSILHPRRFALGVTCILALVLTLTVRGSLPLFVVIVMGLSVWCFHLEEIRTRTRIIVGGFLTSLMLGLTATAGALLNEQTPAFAMEHAVWAAVCGLLAAFVLSGLLPFIERMFRVATSLTLLEWTDSRQPLLQLLAQQAPGTYAHSLLLSEIVDDACLCISANGLMAAVGALYHDIGKIHKAGYFAENQEGLISRHDKLAPTMSLLIILGHVKDGIEMAKEYKLPRVLHRFIAEHHGTTVVKYFHHVASEKQPQIASGKHDRQVAEAEFRYPGPKPRTKETAVLMIADGVEGAVRALPEPTIGRIESAVHAIVTDRLNDGQFDDCDITLKELRLVEESVVKTLSRHYHGRVSYPKRPVAQPRRSSAG